jgi:hypothetical protein
MEEEMKTFRFINTAEGELPVVGDEVYCSGLPEELKWFHLKEEDVQVFMKNSYFLERVFRRELHPQEMAKEIAGELIKEYAPSTVYLKYEDRLKSRMITDRELTEFLIPHIQAALEEKG